MLIGCSIHGDRKWVFLCVCPLNLICVLGVLCTAFVGGIVYPSVLRLYCFALPKTFHVPLFILHLRLGWTCIKCIGAFAQYGNAWIYFRSWSKINQISSKQKPYHSKWETQYKQCHTKEHTTILRVPRNRNIPENYISFLGAHNASTHGSIHSPKERNRTQTANPDYVQNNHPETHCSGIRALLRHIK